MFLLPAGSIIDSVRESAPFPDAAVRYQVPTPLYVTSPFV